VSDGGGLMVLESLESAKKRGANIICEVVGASAFCNSLHPTQPDPSGWDTFTALKRSLLEGGVTPSEVDYVNAHAASNPLGDLPEAVGISKMFGCEKIQNSLEELAKIEIKDVKEINHEHSMRPLVNSFKGNIGHAMLSSGS
jgi:3-oxoacyl-(acyl-carrier-protein) synthase